MQGLCLKNKESLTEEIDSFKEVYIKTWWQCESILPDLGEKYDSKTKRLKEKDMNKFMNDIYNSIINFPGEEEKRTKWREEVQKNIKEFGLNFSRLGKTNVEMVFTDGFSNATEEFIEKTKDFDSTLNKADMFQAIRNVWIANLIQLFANKKMCCTASIFGYSMLYPYTDNFLDDIKINMEQKINMNKRFRRRLSGEKLIGNNENEKKIFSLVDKIEEEYPREYSSIVYESLLAIHRAQEKSLIQQKNSTSPYEKDLMDISIEKGGTSVLADACIVYGKDITREAAGFFFGYGAMLQLCDDLQDSGEDLKNNHMTIFSQTAGKWPLDNITNKLFQYVLKILEAGDNFSNDNKEQIKDLIRDNCFFLIIEAVSQNQKFYSKEYLKIVEQYCPFRFKFLKNFYKNIRKKYSKLEQAYNGVSTDEIIYYAIKP